MPPHVHPTQDEFIPVLEGRSELMLDGEAPSAEAGNLICLPQGLAHGIFDRSGNDVRALFWVAPACGLHELFTRIHNVADPAEVVRIAAKHEFEFLPPSGHGE